MNKAPPRRPRKTPGDRSRAAAAPSVPRAVSAETSAALAAVLGRLNRGSMVDFVRRIALEMEARQASFEAALRESAADLERTLVARIQALEAALSKLEAPAKRSRRKAGQAPPGRTAAKPRRRPS